MKEPCLGLFHQMLDLVLAPHVAREGNNFARQRREFPRRRLEVFHFAAGDGHVGAGRGQPLGDGFADAPSAAGDEGDFALQIDGGVHARCDVRVR